jgi:hypothetical protein
MKSPNFLRPVQQWFKTVGAVGKEPHASCMDEPAKKPKEVVKSPSKKGKKK